MYDDDNNNTPNTQGTDEQTPVNNVPDMNGQSEDHQGGAPVPNNGEGGNQDVDNLPTGNEEDENDTDEDMGDQDTGVTPEDHQ